MNPRRQSPYRTESKKIGRRLFRLAVSWSRDGLPGTQKDRQEQISQISQRKLRINGSRSIRTAREAVEAAAEQITLARAERQAARRRSFVETTWRGHQSGGIPARLSSVLSRGRQPVSLPHGPLSSRLCSRVGSDVLRIAYRNYRCERIPEVWTTKNPAAVGVSQSDSLDWDYYPQAIRYPKKIVETRITVPTSWWLRVRDAGLADIGGMLTLDAQRLEGTPSGVSLYAATWMEQGRGYALHTTRGYIATGLGEDYHGADPNSALRGLRRKLGLRRADAQLENLLQAVGLEQVVQEHPGLDVRVSDAKAMGACEYGIRSWCNRTGLDYAAGSAPIADVYGAYQLAPLREARAAILHALRRQRSRVLQSA